jgi:hypothetical protein
VTDRQENFSANAVSILPCVTDQGAKMLY